MSGGPTASVVTLEKPIQHIGLADWYARLWETRQTADTRRNDAFNLRHQSRQLRNETNIKTQWDTYHNNVRLADRITELDRWRETLQACLDRVNTEMGALKDEKMATERELDSLAIRISIVSECITARDGREGTELTYDDGDTELKKELCVCEGVKNTLIDRCQATWEKLNRLEEVRFKLTLDINDKNETLGIDRDQLTLDKNCANITFKPDAMRVPKDSLPYEGWLEHCRYTKLLADNELADTYKFRESLFVCRERARNDLKAQRDTTDFTLRKRIYETQRARNELEYQQKKMRDELERVDKEITTLEAALLAKTDGLKLAETRLENRSYRPGYELARDECELGLKDEVMQLRQTRQDLIDKINCAKATYNALEDLLVRIDKDLANKCHALMTDIQCLDLRIRLRQGDNAPPKTETDRNIILTRMEQEIPPE